MTDLTQLTTGMLTGLASGLSLELLRPLVRIALGLGMVGAALVLHQAGLPGLLVLFRRFAAAVQFYPVFFTSLAIGKLVGGALLGERR